MENKTIDVDSDCFFGWKSRLFIVFIILTGLGVFVYGKALAETLDFIINRKDASHGPLIPFISAYFVWIKREKLKTLKVSFAPLPGIVISVAGLLLLLFVNDTENITLPTLSYLVIMMGLLYCFLGKSIFKELGFPLFFLVLLVPMPRDWYFQLGEWLRHVGLTSVWVLQKLGLSIYRDVYNVYLPNCDVKVVHACSGVRYLLPFLVLGLAYAYLYKKTLKSRMIVMLTIVPLALVASFSRLFFVFIGVYYLGCYITGFPHTVISWAVFVTTLAGAVFFDLFICKIIQKKEDSDLGIEKKN